MFSEIFVLIIFTSVITSISFILEYDYSSIKTLIFSCVLGCLILVIAFMFLFGVTFNIINLQHSGFSVLLILIITLVELLIVSYLLFKKYPTNKVRHLLFLIYIVLSLLCNFVIYNFYRQVNVAFTTFSIINIDAKGKFKKDPFVYNLDALKNDKVFLSFNMKNSDNVGMAFEDLHVTIKPKNKAKFIGNQKHGEIRRWLKEEKYKLSAIHLNDFSFPTKYESIGESYRINIVLQNVFLFLIAVFNTLFLNKEISIVIYGDSKKIEYKEVTGFRIEKTEKIFH